MNIVLIIICSLYVLTIGLLIWGFKRVPFVQRKTVSKREMFTVVIPFRNEADQLPALLKSFSDLEYETSHFELIFIDDASEDDSVNLIEIFKQNTNYKVLVLKNVIDSNSPKKSAITLAINTSQFDWIITTDADCQVSPGWLNEVNAIIQDGNYDLVAGPVTYIGNSNWLDHFQNFDLLSLQMATIGGFGLGQPFMCNGANLAYKKELFLELNGFSDNKHIASGDDVFLLQKAFSNSKNIGYLKSKEAIVYTRPQASLNLLLQQRKRWAAKTSAYSNILSKFIAVIVLFMNIGILLSLGLAFFGYAPLELVLSLVLSKFIIDFISIRIASNFFDQQICSQYYILSSLLYPIFVLAVCISAPTGGYKWKGRNYPK